MNYPAQKGPSNAGANKIKSHVTPTHSAASQELSQLDRALRWAAAGYLIFPCREKNTANPSTGKIIHPAKAPYTRRGFNDASKDLVLIEKWWGETSPCVDRHPDGQDQRPRRWRYRQQKRQGRLQVLSGARIELPATFVNPTPSGGEHHIYAYPEGVNKVASRNDVLPGVDIKADGGYIVAHGNLMPDGLKALTPYPLALEDAFKAAKRLNGSTQKAPTTTRIATEEGGEKENLAREYAAGPGMARLHRHVEPRDLEQCWPGALRHIRR